MLCLTFQMRIIANVIIERDNYARTSLFSSPRRSFFFFFFTSTFAGEIQYDGDETQMRELRGREK